MQSIAQPAKGTDGISRCIGQVYILLGRNWMHNLQLMMCWWMSMHAYPPEVMFHIVHCAADTLVMLCIMEL